MRRKKKLKALVKRAVPSLSTAGDDGKRNLLGYVKLLIEMDKENRLSEPAINPSGEN